MKNEFNASMDAIRFSQETKQAMVESLMAQMEEQTMQKTTHSRRRLVLVAVAAAMLIAMLTGAAVFTRWSKTVQTKYNPSEDIKKQAEDSGLSVMLDATQPNEMVLRATDQNITVTALQTIVDNYGAELIFRVDGLSIPEGRFPWAWVDITIDGSRDFYVYMGRSYLMYETEDQNSFECTVNIRFNETDGRYLGKDIAVHFNGFGFDSAQKAGDAEKVAEGSWDLKWTLTGTSDSITIAPNAKIGDSGVILLDAEIGQKTIRARYQVNEYWEGWDELVTLPQAVCGVRMKDGSEHLCGGGTSGFEDQENMIYFTESDMFDAILDISQVESLMFLKGWEADDSGELTVQTFYYIPIA